MSKHYRMFRAQDAIDYLKEMNHQALLDQRNRDIATGSGGKYYDCFVYVHETCELEKGSHPTTINSMVENFGHGYSLVANETTNYVPDKDPEVNAIKFNHFNLHSGNPVYDDCDCLECTSFQKATIIFEQYYELQIQPRSLVTIPMLMFIYKTIHPTGTTPVFLLLNYIVDNLMNVEGFEKRFNREIEKALK